MIPKAAAREKDLDNPMREERKSEERKSEKRPAPPAPGTGGGTGRTLDEADVAKAPASGGNGHYRPRMPSAIKEAPGKDGKPVPPTVKEKPKTPTVWHRDRSRPTFARVYVGDKNALELVSLHVSVTIEGPRARTLVDHVFRNPHDRQLEGTFEYPLPAGASPSYFAMFLGQTRDAVPPRFRPPVVGAGQEAHRPGVAATGAAGPTDRHRRLGQAPGSPRRRAKEKALEAYEEVVRGRIDPALLEYASGNTFRGRVFPIPPKGYNRVLLAYEETLPCHRFAPAVSLQLADVPASRAALLPPGRPARLQGRGVPAQGRAQGGRRQPGRISRKTWSDTTPEGEVVFSATPADPRVQATSGRHGEDGPLYLYARLRPELPKIAKEEPFAKHAVVPARHRA